MAKFGRMFVALVALFAIAAMALFTAGTATARRRGLIAPLEDASGNAIGTVRFMRTDDGKISVRLNAAGLTPGFHGFHIHNTGVCDPAALDTGGNPVPFFTAGGHYNPVSTNTHGSHAGDMLPLLVNEDGTASLRFKTDRVTLSELMADDGSAVILHAGLDNLGNIPAATSAGGERYHSHVDDVFGPDTATKATGDAGSRFGCGIVEKASD